MLSDKQNFSASVVNMEGVCDVGPLLLIHYTREDYKDNSQTQVTRHGTPPRFGLGGPGAGGGFGVPGGAGGGFGVPGGAGGGFGVPGGAGGGFGVPGAGFGVPGAGGGLYYPQPHYPNGYYPFYQAGYPIPPASGPHAPAPTGPPAPPAPAPPAPAPPAPAPAYTPEQLAQAEKLSRTMWMDATVHKSFATEKEFRSHRYDGYDEVHHALAFQMVQGFYDEEIKKHSAHLVETIRNLLRGGKTKEEILDLEWPEDSIYSQEEVINALDYLLDTMSVSPLPNSY